MNNIEKIKVENSDQHAPLIVLVIGESFNKYHSSLYGYELKTNPLLEKRIFNLIMVRIYDRAIFL